MKLRDILFTGMNIPNEARQILEQLEGTDDMTDSELKAYKMGIENTLSIVKALLEQDEHIVFHLENRYFIEEFDLDELIEIVEEKEGY